MTSKNHGRRVTLLVWTLVSIGLLAGVVTNGLAIWTLMSLNRDQVRLLEQDRELTQEAGRLQRLGQQLRAEVATLLQGRESAHQPVPLEDIGFLLGELKTSFDSPAARSAMEEIETAIIGMALLRERARDWLIRSQTVHLDLREKRTLGEARDLLERLQVSAERLEGQQRLREAVLLRRWRRADGEQSARLAQSILENQAGRWARVLKEVRTELAELSRLVETLAGEDQIDYLTDLRDNQLKPVLERLEHQIDLLNDELQTPADLNPALVAQLRTVLFGRGHAIVAEYQTIRIGEGGLFRLASDALALRQERNALQREAQRLFDHLEVIHPVMTRLAEEREILLNNLARMRLIRVLQQLSLVAVIVLIGFLWLGGRISKNVRQQVTTLGRLRRQNELILNSAGEGILGLDRKGRATFINPAAVALVGQKPEDILGRSYREILRYSPAEADSGKGAVRTVLEAGESFHFDDQIFRRDDGSNFHGECTATPIRNEKGEIEGAVVTLLDITDRKEAEAALQRSYADLDELNQHLEEKVHERTMLLEAKNRELLKAQDELVRKEQLAAVGSLAAGVAHEINNPAAIIRGNVEILLRRLPEDHREEVREILQSTERISGITQNLLIFARAQSIHPMPLQVNDLLEEILAQVPHQVGVGQVEIVPRFDAALPALRSDREKLRQVFTNLIVNALQAMDGAGRLTVATSFRDGRIAIEVADTGPGIPEENRAKIFNPFFTTKSRGTGLGLSVSYGIVQALGGRLEVASRMGEGAVFTVLLAPEPGAVGDV